MIIDPKLEKMFRQCHERKMRLDRKRKLIRAAMFGPPALLALLCFIHMIMAFVSGVMIVFAGGFLGVYPDIPCFILSVITSLFVAGQTMLDSKTLMEGASKFYPLAAVAYGVSFSYTFPIYRGAVIDIPGVTILLGQFLMVISCVLSTVLSIIYKQLYAENEMLRTLKGYPHFNPVLMREADLHEEDAPDRKPPEEMTPDERLMWERDSNFKAGGNP